MKTKSATSSPPLPRAIHDCHTLLAWLIPQLDHFPRSRRFTLGARLESGFLALLELLIEAAYTSQKTPTLHRANRQLAVNRHLWRLAWELKLINFKLYEHGARLIDELGQQIGGWIKFKTAPHETPR